MAEQDLSPCKRHIHISSMKVNLCFFGASSGLYALDDVSWSLHHTRKSVLQLSKFTKHIPHVYCIVSYDEQYGT